VCAFVVTSGPFDLDECRRWFEVRGVARYQTPERVVCLDELPVLAAGKPDRATLTRRAAADGG
jgi:non-ribosomal peptide synthetase component E (peptide arylation enzyme)